MKEGLLGFGFVVVVVVIVFLVIGLIGAGIAQIEIPASIAEFEAVQLTLDTARANPGISVLELAAIQQKAVEQNAWLARVRYFNGLFISGWAVTNRVERLEPIK